MLRATGLMCLVAGPHPAYPGFLWELGGGEILLLPLWRLADARRRQADVQG